MSSKIVGYVLAVGLLGGAAQAEECPDASRDTFIAPAVKSLADRLQCPSAAQGSQGLQAADTGSTNLVPMIVALDGCSRQNAAGETESAAGDLTDALLLKNYNVFSVVRDTILACGQKGKGREVAALVASRALMVKGPGARYLIDAGVLAAASRMADSRRGAEPTAAAAQIGAQGSGTGQQTSMQVAQLSQQSDPERERLERMMEKGLLTDEYRDFIEQKRQAIERGYPDPVGYLYEPNDVAVFGALYTEALVGGDYLDRTLEQRADPGGYASAQ